MQFQVLLGYEAFLEAAEALDFRGDDRTFSDGGAITYKLMYAKSCTTELISLGSSSMRNVGVNNCHPPSAVVQA